LSKIFLAVTHKHWKNGLKFCQKHRINLEIVAFSNPQTLDSNLNEYLSRYTSDLKRFKGKISIHGPFYDLYPASVDRKIQQLCKYRFLQCIEIAEKLGSEIIILHFNFIPFIKIKNLREKWVTQAIEFWNNFNKEIDGTGIKIAVENLWEPDPEILAEVLDKVKSEQFKVCFDVAHSSLFSDYSLEYWIDKLGRYIYYIHVHNNFGKYDEHLPLNKGNINYDEFFKYLKSTSSPYISMEFDGEEQEFKESLLLIRKYFN